MARWDGARETWRDWEIGWVGWGGEVRGCGGVG